MCMQDTFQLYAFAFSLQLLNLIPFAWRASVAYPQTPGAWVIKLLDTLTHSAPPSIPTVFLVLTYIARLRLDRAGISLLYSKALHVGAYVNMVCFDKTGTLTDSVVSLYLFVTASFVPSSLAVTAAAAAAAADSHISVSNLWL